MKSSLRAKGEAIQRPENHWIASLSLAKTASPRFNLIGSGKLGRTLSKLIVHHNLGTLMGVFNRTLLHAEQAIAFIGEGSPYPTLDALPHTDLYLITTPDAAIAPVAKVLSQSIQAPAIVLHCSGALCSDALLPLKSKGCFIASIHPIHAFADPEHSLEHYAGSYCAIEGDPEALTLIKPILEGIGSKCFPISKDKKAMYHAATVFASNYLITLAQQALSCLQSAGVESATAFPLTLQLMKTNLLNLEKTGSAEAALTGPIQRADVETLQQHLAALENFEQKKLYSLLAQQTLDLTKHDETTKKSLKQAISAGVTS